MTARQRSLRVAVATCAATALMGITLVVSNLGALQRTSAAEVISGPSHWIPLAYEVATTRNGVAEKFSYIEYRSANGSTRRERSDGRDIQIRNAASGKYYRMLNTEWTEHPMRPQVNNGQPYLQIKREAATLVPPDDPRVQGLVGAGIPLTFYEWRPQPGNGAFIYCPELNMLEVWSRRDEGEPGVVERRVTRILLNEPSVDFAPPANVPVTVRVDAAGPGRVSAIHGLFKEHHVESRRRGIEFLDAVMWPVRSGPPEGGPYDPVNIDPPDLGSPGRVAIGARYPST